MKCILLVRVSTKAQIYEEQEREIYNLALKDGYKEEDIISIGYKESGRKLAEEERLGLNEMKSLIEKGDINCIYAWEISRIARTKKVLFSISDYLLTRKIQLVIKEPSLRLLKADGSIDEAAEMAFTLYAQLAEAEMRTKFERFARGKRQKAREGKYVGGKLPYGYKISEEGNKLIEVDEEEAKIVRLIYTLYESGISQPNIAIELERIGIFNMKISLINNILKNRHYIGEPFKRKDTKDCKYNERIYPPIISKEQFEKCRGIAHSNNTNASKTRNIYFAENLVHCLSCGCKWSASGSKVSYHCYNAYKSKKLLKYEYTKKEQCINKLSISINILDSLLWEITIDEEASSLLSDNKNKIKEAEKEVEEIEIKQNATKKRLDNIVKKKKRLSRTYIDGGIDEEEYTNLNISFNEKSNKIKEEEIRYKTEIERINNFISHLKKEVVFSQRFANYNSYLNELKEIEDEQQMYDLIHKHILYVKVEPIKFIYTFEIGEKETKAKHITVQTFSRQFRKNEPLEFIYIPFDGRGGKTILKKGVIRNEEPYYQRFFYRYLNRFQDPIKVRLKEERKVKRERKKK